MDTSPPALSPIKASLVADLVSLINENIGELLHVRVVTCTDCRDCRDADGELTCATCGGVGAVERYGLNHEQLKKPRFGRLLEGFDVKCGQLVPKFRSKDKAFAMLTKILGLDKAIVEIAHSASFVDSISDEQRISYIEQLKELAKAGALDNV